MEQQAETEFNKCNQLIAERNQLIKLEFGRFLPDTRFVVTELGWKVNNYYYFGLLYSLKEQEYEAIVRIRTLKNEISRLRKGWRYIYFMHKNHYLWLTN